MFAVSPSSASTRIVIQRLTSNDIYPIVFAVASFKIPEF
jgi:hypothetical protein